MVFGLFKPKKEKSIQRALDPHKDNMSRIKALDYLEELAKKGDDEATTAILRCFQITVKPDKQEQSLTPYDDEQEKWSLIDRLVGMADRRLDIIKLLRKELATPPLLSPGRRDGIVWLIELLKALAEETTEDEEEMNDMVLDELIRALKAYDPEETYREPGRKIELVRALGRHESPKTTEVLLPFLEDVDESVRFHVIESLATAGDDTASEALCTVILEDESLRNQERAVELLAELNCSIKGHPNRKEIEARFPKSVMVDKKGVVKYR